MRAAALLGALAFACTRPLPAATREAPGDAGPPTAQSAGGRPYELLGTQVWAVPDPLSHRTYQVFVSLPAGYDGDPGRRYPVLYVADADYAFPMVRAVARRLNGDGARIKDFILVGLSYAGGEDAMASRRRDYTPTPGGAPDAPTGAVYGGGPAYQDYLKRRVIPFVAARYRTDEASRYFLGHSYGGLLGAQILLSDPTLFRGYVLGSPSLWYDRHAMLETERVYTLHHHDLPASVYLYVGEYERVRPGDPRYAGNRNDMVGDAETFARTLRDRHYPSLRLEAEVLNDEDHLTAAPRGATHGLERLLASPSAALSR